MTKPAPLDSEGKCPPSLFFKDKVTPTIVAGLVLSVGVIYVAIIIVCIVVFLG